MYARKIMLAAVTAACTLAALPAAAAADEAATVCNEAENSPRGGYVVTGGPVDSAPPAFLRGSQMQVGNGHGEGLGHAAEVSPALRLCESEGGEDPNDPDDPGLPAD